MTHRTIIILGDIHGAYRGVARIVEQTLQAPPDLVLLVGDLGSDVLWSPHESPLKVQHWQASIHKIMAALQPLGRPVAFVPGNHDRPDPATPGFCWNIDRQCMPLEGIRLAGIGGAGPKPFGLPYEWTEAQLDASLQALAWKPDTIDVLLSHAPPKKIGLDRTLSGHDAGSETLGQWIKNLRPALFVCGHIHEGVGHTMLGSTLVVNAGRLIWASSYDQYGRPQVGSQMAFQYYKIVLKENRPQSIERIRLACTGPLRVVQQETWQIAETRQL